VLFLISDTFTDSLARLAGDEQKSVKTTAFDLQMNPANPGMSFHKLDKAKDKNFWSVQIALPKIRVDRRGGVDEIGHALPMRPPETSLSASPRPRRKRRFLRWLLYVLVVLGLGLGWLNGPGLRWLGPLAARHFLPKAGFTGELRIEGNLSHGFSIAGLKLESSGVLGKLTLDRATPHYQWANLVKGKLDGLSLDGVHADLRLGLKDDSAKSASAGQKPLDLNQLAATIRKVREQVLPVELHLTRLSLGITRDDQSFVTLAPTHLHHLAGKDDITLEIGAITDPTGREWPAQTTTLTWAEDAINVDQLDPLPSLGLRELEVRLPAAETPSLRTLIRLDEAVFELATTPGCQSATLALRSGSLQVAETAKGFGVAIPAAARLAALTLTADNVLPDPFAATGRLELALDGITYQDWQVPALSLAATLEPARATATVRAQALGSPVKLDGEIVLGRSEKSLVPGPAKGTFEIPAIPQVVNQLAQRFAAIDPDASVPDAALSGGFTVDLSEKFQLRGATVETTLTPADPALATPIAIKARYWPEQPLAADARLDGLDLSATYDIKAQTYQGKLALKEFSSARLDRWLAIAGVSVPGTAGLTASWQGGGDLAARTHHGDLALVRASWDQPEKQPILASGTIGYDWPGKVTISELKAETEQQTLTLAGGLAKETLTLERFLWRNGDTEMAEGSASIPVPADFSQWRDTLAHDPRPVSVALESRVLSLALLEPWLPAAAKLDPQATGQLKLNVSGSYPEPAVDLALDCRNLRSPEQPKLPPADLKLTVKGGAGHLAVAGSVTAPDYAPTVITASMPFRPAVWAEAPDSIKDENLTARVDLPRLDLSRFTTLVPAAKQLAGIVTGHVEAGGKVGKPEARGSIRLDNAAVTLANPAVPPIQAAGAEVDLSLTAITLKNLRASIAGGSLTGSGVLNLADNQPSALDFRLRGDHLPLLRNDMLILRANADLRVAGPWQSAALTGTVAAVDSLFYRDIELLPIGKPFTTPSAASLPRLDAGKTAGKAAGIPAPFAAWTLNLSVRTQEPFLIRGNLATGQVDAGIRVIGTLADPKLDGTAVLSDFSASLPFSTLQVKSGTVRFTPATGFDPILEIRGTAEPRPYRVAAYVYGKASDPQIMLTANPPLPETEIMTLLATGTTTAGLEDTRAATNRAIQLFAEEIRRGRVRYTKQLRPLLGLLDRVDFSLKESDPYSTDSFSTATISLTDRFLVSAGMGEEGNTRLMGIWRISFK
jgi:hypothetical protein